MCGCMCVKDIFVGRYISLLCFLRVGLLTVTTQSFSHFLSWLTTVFLQLVVDVPRSGSGHNDKWFKKRSSISTFV